MPWSLSSAREAVGSSSVISESVPGLEPLPPGELGVLGDQHHRGSLERIECILALILDNARRLPRYQAVVCGEQRWTWGDLGERIARLAGGLREPGIGCGDRVALWLDNNPWFVVAFFAVLRLGAVAAPLSPALRRGDSDLLGITFDAVVTREGLARSFGAASLDAGNPPRLLVLPDTDAPTSLLDRGAITVPAGDPDAPALMQFSSGTTGLPKALQRTHRQCLAEAG